MNTRVLVTVLFVVAVAVNTATATTGFTVNSTSPLNATVTSQNCMITKYCGFLPSSCNPSSQGCYFASAQPTAAGFVIGLSGNSSGYIAATVTSHSSVGLNDSTFICASGNSTVDFTTALNNNNTMLIPANVSVTSVNGTINGSITQCIINTKITSATLINIYNGTYMYNSTTRDFGNPNFLFQMNVTVPLGNSTGSNYGTTIRQSMTPALLITAGVLGLTMM